MKKLLMLMFVALVFSGVSSAVTICASGLSVGPGPSALVINCGGLKFDNFQVLNVSGGASGIVGINSVEYDAATGYINLLTNGGTLGANQHIDLFFRVSGGINAIDLAVGGTNATVTERACLNPIPTGGILANVCTNAAGDVNAPPLGQITLHSGDSGQPLVAPFTLTSPVYIFKDISTGPNGGLSTLNQSFHIPEPMSMLLFGSGLAALGVVRRRRK